MDDLDLVINYLHDNYYNDCERLARNKSIQSMTQGYAKNMNIPTLIDKVALFNNIKKTYPPKRTLKQEIIRGVGFIMYGG